ncbi:MAG: HEAT repeat domain-containing protein [Pseudomonadota bacterium]
MVSRLSANIRTLLAGGDLESLKALAVGGQPVVRGLVSLLYDEDAPARWKAISALGQVCATLERSGRSERVHDLVRRLFWMMNDESGGSGRHLPEAVGEILYCVPVLLPAFGPMLATHLDIDLYTAGVCWAVGRMSQRDRRLFAFVLPEVRKDYLGHEAPEIRALAAWCLGWAKDEDARPLLAELVADSAEAVVFEDGELRKASVGQLATEALGRLNRP